MASPPYTVRVEDFFRKLRLHQDIPEDSERKNFYSDMILSHLKVDHIESGRIYCTLKVDASCANLYNTLHGGVVASVAAAVGLACAKMTAGDKEFFLGEHSTAYLAAAGINNHSGAFDKMYYFSGEKKLQEAATVFLIKEELPINLAGTGSDQSSMIDEEMCV